MDILAHALWSALTAKIINLKKKHKLSLLKTALWGIFPDLFAFTLLFIILTLGTLFGTTPMPDHNNIEPAMRNGNISIITEVLYEFSHSIVIFSIIMLVLYVSFGRIVREMFGWGLHIIIDIPTHSYKFYPTPFLWPFSEFRFDGISWGQSWFQILNYSTMVIVFLVIWWLERKKMKKRK